jgi:hypothetical protein
VKKTHCLAILVRYPSLDIPYYPSSLVKRQTRNPHRAVADGLEHRVRFLLNHLACWSGGEEVRVVDGGSVRRRLEGIEGVGDSADVLGR